MIKTALKGNMITNISYDDSSRYLRSELGQTLMQLIPNADVNVHECWCKR